MPLIGWGPWIYQYSNSNSKKNARYANREEFRSHSGQWIAHGESKLIEDTFHAMRKRVGKGVVDEMKYSKEGNDGYLVVYCDDRRKDEVKTEIERFGLMNMRWKYQRECVDLFLGLYNAAVTKLNELDIDISPITERQFEI